MMAHVLPTSVTFADQWHLFMRVPDFALHITVTWSSTGPILSDMAIAVSASLLQPSGTMFRHTVELKTSFANSSHHR